MLGDRAGMTANPTDLVAFALLGLVEVPPHLAVHPEPAGGAEVSGEPESSARCDPPALVHDLVYSLIGHPDRLCQLSLCKAERLEELLEQHLSWMCRGSVSWNPDHVFTSVVVDYLNLDRTRFRPLEADPVLVVDPDAVLPAADSPECLEVVPRWNSHVVQDLGLVEGIESSRGHLPERAGQPLPRGFRVATIEQVLGCLITEAPDH